MEHKSIQAQGGRVHYWIGRQEPDKPCIVFTHGLTADHTMFEKQVAYFSSKYTLILWDVPLHGASRPYTAFSYEDTAYILHGILTAEGIDKAVLVGMSMGGYPSQFFADKYPQMVRGFVALDTTPVGREYYLEGDMRWLKRVAPIAKLFSQKALQESMAKSISLTDYSHKKMMEILKPLSKEDIVEQLDIAYGQFAKENKALSLSCPVLILVGDKDNTGKVKAYCKSWAKKTGYPLHWIQNARHFSNGDNPQQVNSEIESFVEGLSHSGTDA